MNHDVFQPTDEQRAIVADQNRVLRVNARAGTGKTTTLRLLAEAHPRQSILYLAFNSRTRIHAGKTFPGNVTAHTVHSLAFRFEGHKWRAETDEAFKDLSPTDLLPYFNGRPQAHLQAGTARDFLTFFLNSPHPQLEDAVADFGGIIKEPARNLFKTRSESFVSACRDLATRWYRRERPCPHDFYLKLFHKSGDFDRALDRYDLVLVDEAQDLSPVMMDALKRCRRREVIVGDSHQQIYGFRYAVDAMKGLPADTSLDLTLSFRFGKPIANFNRWLIRTVKEEPGFKLHGNPRIRSRIQFGTPARDGDYAMLCRTNLALFTRAIELQSREQEFRFERDIGKVLYATLDIFNLYKGDKHRIRNEWIRSFDDFEALKSYADAQEDFQLKTQIQVVEQYHRLFPGIVFELTKFNEEGRGESVESNLILTTVHSAKGQEYERVYVHGDVPQTLVAAQKASADSFSEEANIAYVACTRAKHELVLAHEFRKIDGLAEWYQDFKNKISKRSQPTDAPRMDPISDPEKESEHRSPSQSIPRRKRERSSVPPPQPTIEVGNRVMTAHGRGRIEKLEGEHCWVRLEDSEALVREWERSVRPLLSHD